jgi:hypothetical protein
MDINCYLPDELGARAKEADIRFSPLLQQAVRDELDQLDAVKEALSAGVQTYELDIEDRDTGAMYTGRVTGKRIAYDERNDDAAFLTDDERVLVYSASQQRVFDVTDDPDEGLNGFPPGEYTGAMSALGLKAVIDL